jgi:ABC-type nitrate/sulfonate/bicarbonate transport system substrate-binding protein
VAAGQADLAITYQPQVHFFADEGLPLVRVGTLINSPLNTVIALDKRIKTPRICKAKRWAIRSAASSRPRWRPWRNMPISIRQHQAD